MARLSPVILLATLSVGALTGTLSPAVALFASGSFFFYVAPVFAEPEDTKAMSTSPVARSIFRSSRSLFGMGVAISLVLTALLQFAPVIARSLVVILSGFVLGDFVFGMIVNPRGGRGATLGTGNLFAPKGWVLLGFSVAIVLSAWVGGMLAESAGGWFAGSFLDSLWSKFVFSSVVAAILAGTVHWRYYA